MILKNTQTDQYVEIFLDEENFPSSGIDINTLKWLPEGEAQRIYDEFKFGSPANLYQEIPYSDFIKVLDCTCGSKAADSDKHSSWCDTVMSYE